MRIRPPRRKEYDSSDASFEEYQSTYQNAHRLVCASKTLDVVDGQFSTELKIPFDASGSCTVRAVLISERELAMGSAPVKIKKVSPPRTAEAGANKNK